ncbi:CrcB family protein [Limosilactobacillus pontis]|uniref:fluoride efflux transporter FluC n=1 Tax=Limosilactobacillus pontis TaxID=35787 RepID=UPI002F26C6CC
MLSVGCGAALGALLINLTGALVLGFLTGHLAADGAAMRFWGVGLLGGYTTFSTFNTELVAMVDERRWGSLVAYLILSYGGGLVAAWVGMQM